uniref:STE20-like serine/threonine-protein kinase n=1 Tax=Hirondellea gigas TaxID=1518452 RepID=A0A2P2HZL7_9CRUS
MPLFSKVRDIFKSGTSVRRKKVYHNVLLQNPDEIWSIKGEIGDGAYGKVYKAENISNGTLAALKKVALEEEDDLDNFMVEIDILAECQHPNIVQLLEAYHWEGCLWMYLEFCDGGAVDTIMVDLDRPLTEPQIAYLCKNLLEALDYIHKSKVIHRDLKAGNVLLTTNGGVKLADFGVSAKNKNTMDKRGTFIGTPYWLAPEVIKCETFIDSKYDYKADIWSLGITLIEFAQMDPPNHEVSPLRVLLKIQKAEPPKLDCPSKFSKEFNDFIAQCLIKEPEDRPDARALLRHPFVNKDHSAKHIIALLIEYQADVVEEDVEDDRDHVTPTGVMDRRATKGPAPPPPGQLKKGPAPSAPAPAKAVPTVTTAGALPQTTVVPAVATAASTTATTTPSVASSPVTTPTLPANSSKLPSLVTSTPIKLDNSEQSAAVAATVAAAAAATTVTAATATVTIAASTAAPLTTTTTTPITNDDDDADVVIVTASSRVNSVSTDDAIVSVGDSVTDSVSYITATTTTTVVSSVVSVSNVADNVTTTAAATSSLPSSVVTTCVPLTVVSPAVCVSTAAVQDIPSDGRKVSQDVSMVSITSLGEDYIAAPDLDSESSRILSEKLEVMEDDDDLVVSHQAMIVEPSSSKTLITSDNTNVADTTNNEVPMEVSATVLSIADSSNTEDINTVDISTNNSILTTKIASPTTPPDIVVSSPQITETPITFETLIPAELGDGDDDDDIMYDTFSASKRSADARQRAPDSPGVSTPDLPIELAATGDGVVVMTQEAVDAAASVSDSVVLVEDRTQDLALNVRREHDLPPAQIIASIGSEGTVILRTPTPTPSSPTPPSGTPTPSLVTFSGPGVVESSPLVPDSSSEQPPHSQDERDTAPVSFDYSLAEEEAVQLLDDVLDHVATTTSATTASGNDSIISTDSTIASSDVAMVTAGADAATVAAASEVVVVSAGEGKKERAQQVVISNSSILEGESNTDDITPNRSSEQLAAAGGGADDAANISVVSVAETEKLRNSIEAAGLLLPSDTKVIIEGTTLGDTDTDTDNFVTSKDGVVSLSSEESDQTQAQQQQYYIDSRENMHILKPVLPEDSRSDSDSVSTVSSEKENSKPRGRSSTSGGEEEVQLRRPARLNSTDTSASTLNRSVNSINVTSNSIASTDGSLKPIDKNRQNRQGNLMRNGRTKEENDSLALRKKTRKRTRKFMIDGVIVTTTTSKVIYGDDEDGSMITSGHLARKQELRELKILQKLEQKQFQELGIKSTQARQEQDRKFDTEKTQLIRSYDNDVDTLNRQQKQQVERIEAQHEIELKSVSKKIRGEQEKDLRLFRESLKTELKLLKQEVDLLPKDVRKEALRTKKDRLEAEQAAKEKEFLERLHQNHESSMKRLSEEHRSHVALLERQFLQKKHQMLRAREAALWELEERHLHDRHQLAKRQLKDIFFLQRHQMLLRHEKELEQVRRQNTHREEELVKRQVVERRSMPKRIRQEMKARELMFRESMRISCTNLPDTHQDEKDKIRKFQECERRRYEAEKKRGEQKHKRQLEELVAATDAHAKELEQMQNEKRKMLMEHETVKLKAQEEEYQRELKEWKNNLKPRKQKLEDEFEHQLQDQEQFYGAYLTTCGGTMLAPALPDPQH